MRLSRTMKMEAGIILCLVMIGGAFAGVLSGMLTPGPSGEYNANGVNFNYVEFDDRFVYLDFNFEAINQFDTYTHVVTVVDFGDGNVYTLGDYPVGRVVVALNEPADMAGNIKAVNIYAYDSRYDSVHKTLIISLNAMDLEELAR